MCAFKVLCFVFSLLLNLLCGNLLLSAKRLMEIERFTLKCLYGCYYSQSVTALGSYLGECGPQEVYGANDGWLEKVNMGTDTVALGQMQLIDGCIVGL